MKIKLLAPLAAVTVLLGSIRPAAAQWQTQSILIKPGWTAIYLHVDPSYTTLNSLIGSDPRNPIDQVWLWEPPASTIQFVTSPSQPTTPNTQWASWVRTGSGPGNTLASLIPNAGYLVHSVATTNYIFTVKGQPATPIYAWKTTGLNLFGFPTVSNNPATVNSFLTLAPTLSNNVTMYYYPGGKLNGNNPIPVILPGTNIMTRGQAFWIGAGSYFNNYFGPFQVDIDQRGAGGLWRLHEPDQLSPA